MKDPNKKWSASELVLSALVDLLVGLILLLIDEFLI